MCRLRTDSGGLRAYGVPMIEDAAEALGARYDGRSAGTFAPLGVFSFNGNKIITTSGGGMLVCDSAELAGRARFLATQARDPAPHYQHSEIGYNYRMSNLLAAIGRGQLRVLEDRVERRRANFEFYREALGDLPGIGFMPEHPRSRSTRWLTCITVDPGHVWRHARRHPPGDWRHRTSRPGPPGSRCTCSRHFRIAACAAGRWRNASSNKDFVCRADRI